MALLLPKSPNFSRVIIAKREMLVELGLGLALPSLSEAGSGLVSTNIERRRRRQESIEVYEVRDGSSAAPEQHCTARP